MTLGEEILLNTLREIVGYRDAIDDLRRSGHEHLVQDAIIKLLQVTANAAHVLRKVHSNP